ncbi:hypothetical protein D9613_011771 [Agrocybe pediades]|uniref:DUF6533 domain-containing protein n=1 Tax=Agrocybe pediades TaxID=84607 RepID=A0A8H4VLX3_9AGAR|nr:hypothetical protein D9613_011771 [Agrocybe pediades]
MGGAALISDSPDYALLWMVWATKGASISALLFQFLEFFNQFIEEVEYLWSGRIRLISYLYGFCRYFPLGAQIVNIILSELIHNAPSERLCMTAFVMKAATAQLTTTCVETILVVRVHALYNCSRLSGLFLLGILAIGTCFELCGAIMTIMQLQPRPGNNICKPARSSLITISFFAIGCGLIESVLLVMTLAKIILSRNTGWLRTPVISLMLRDSVSVFILLVTESSLLNCTVITSTVVGFEVVRSIDDKVSLWAAAYSWYVALLSASGCRIILNMRMLGATHYRQQRRQQRPPTYPYPTTNEEDLSTSTIAQFSTIIDLSHDEDDASEDTNHSDYLDVRRRQLYYDS